MKRHIETAGTFKNKNIPKAYPVQQSTHTGQSPKEEMENAHLYFV